MPEKANAIFERVMPYLDEKDDSFNEDVDHFLDLKIEIEKELDTKKNKDL